MNKDRRKAIQSVISKIHELEETMTDILDEIETIKNEEEEYLNNIPENLQTSARYETAENAVSELESAFNDFESAKDSLDEIVSALENACE